MSRWLPELLPALSVPKWADRWPALAGRDSVRTVFLQPDAAWSYARDEAAPTRIVPVADWTGVHAGGNVRLVLSGALTYQLVVSDPELPLEDVDALQSWARHQFVHYHGPAAQRWPLAPWLQGTQRGASSVHGIDLDAMLQRAREQRIRLRAVQPWWAVALKAAEDQAPPLSLAERAELWLVEALQVTRVVCEQGRVLQIEQHWLERADAPALGSLLAALAGPEAGGKLAEGRTLPWVVGYGLAPEGLEALPVRWLGLPTGDSPPARWIGG